MNNLKNIELKISELLENRTKEIADCAEQIELLEQKSQSAIEGMAQAEREVDAKGYAKYKTDLWTSKQSIDMYVRRKEKLESEPLIDRDEYNKYIKEIKDTLDNFNISQAKKIIEILSKLEPIQEEAGEILEKGNNLISIIQNRVFKEPDVVEVEDGDRILRQARPREKYSDYIVYQLIEDINRIYAYKTIKEREGK